MPKASYTPGAEDLYRLGEHLFYEVVMLYRLPPLVIHSPGLYPQDTRNALIEAFTIHVRQLIDFFWPEGARHKSTALASDYFDRDEWEGLRPGRPEILSEALRQKVGWGVAHLTYDRAWAPPEEKGWDFVGLARAFAPAVICFADHVGPDRLDPAYPQAMKAYAAEFLAASEG